MRKYCLLFVVSYVICSNILAAGQQPAPLDSLLQQYNTMQSKLDTMEHHIESINLHMAQVQQNTMPTWLSDRDWDDVCTLVFSLISALGAGLTFYELRRKRKKATLDKEAQTELMKRMVWQMYFNKTIIQSIILTMEKKGWNNYYPSEENFLRLTIYPEDFFFADMEDRGLAVKEESRIKFKFRSYNSDVETFCQHMKNPHIPANVKRGDLDSLDFRIGHLTHYMIAIMYNLGMREGNKMDRKSLYRSVEDFIKEVQIQQHKDIISQYPNRQFNYAKVYQPRLDYQTRTTIEQRWDADMQSERFFFDKQRAQRMNDEYLDLTEILDWDIQFLLDPETQPETIRLLPYSHKKAESEKLE